MTMARGGKSKYTDKQKRQAEHIEEGYEERGVSEEEAERRAWATVNKMTGGGKKSGAGRGKPVNNAPARKGGRLGGAASCAAEGCAFGLGEEGGRDASAPQTRECLRNRPHRGWFTTGNPPVAATQRPASRKVQRRPGKTSWDRSTEKSRAVAFSRTRRASAFM